jgi:hypothetical protein
VALALNNSGAAFYNAGTFMNSPANSSATVEWPFTNFGQVTVGAGGGLTFNGGFTQAAGNTLVSTSGTLAVKFKSTVFVQGGTLSGTGIIDGSLMNSGIVHAGGSPGQLTIINGSFTNAANGVLAVELDGTNPAQYSQLSNSGNDAYFGGILRVTLAGGFTPSLGDTFKIFNNGTPHGSFTSVQVAQAGNGIALVPRYNASDVTLTAVNEPALRGLNHTGNGINFTFQSTAGFNIIIEFTDSLSLPNWQILANVAGDGTLQSVVDPVANSRQRFYRARFQ